MLSLLVCRSIVYYNSYYLLFYMKSEVLSRPLLKKKSTFLDPNDLQNMYLAEKVILKKKSIDEWHNYYQN